MSCSSYCYKDLFRKRISTFTPKNKYAFSPKIYYNLFGSKNYSNYSQMLLGDGNITIFESRTLTNNINYFINMRTNSKKIQAKQIFLENIRKKRKKMICLFYMSCIFTNVSVFIPLTLYYHSVNIVNDTKLNYVKKSNKSDKNILTMGIGIGIAIGTFLFQKQYIKYVSKIKNKLLKYFDLYKPNIPILVKLENNIISNKKINYQVIENKIYKIKHINFMGIIFSPAIDDDNRFRKNADDFCPWLPKYINNFAFHPYLKNNYINVFEPICENDINSEIKYELFYIFDKYLPKISNDLTNIIIEYTVDYTYNIEDNLIIKI